MQTHIWYNGRVSVFGKGISTIVHDAGVVVWHSEIRHHSRIVFVKVPLRPIDNVIPFDFHMLVSIDATLHVEKSQSCDIVENMVQLVQVCEYILVSIAKCSQITVQKFVHNCAQPEATGARLKFFQIQHLFAPLISDH